MPPSRTGRSPFSSPRHGLVGWGEAPLALRRGALPSPPPCRFILALSQRRLSRRFYRPPVPMRLYGSLPAHMRLAMIFAAGPVRHMSVRAGARAGETTDNHGQRPCKLATSRFAWSASAIHVGCAWNIRGKPGCDAEQMQFQGVCVANLADLRKPGRRGKGRQARCKRAGKRLGSSQRREIAFHDAQSRAGASGHEKFRVGGHHHAAHEP